MIQEINNPLHLIRLVEAKRITLQGYQLRMKANSLKINTYKETT